MPSQPVNRRTTTGFPERFDDPYRELLLGCGRTRDRRFNRLGEERVWHNLTALDFVPDAERPGEDFVEWDLTRREPMPFADGTFDEIHAYHILEHIGAQGDFVTFFRQFADYWRILKPSGFLFALVPQGRVWTWGDPGHTREINQGSLVFLSQAEYIKQCDIPETRTSMTDYRRWWKGDFDLVFANGVEDPDEFRFILQAVKPSRIKSR